MESIIDEFVSAAHGDFERVKELLRLYPSLINGTATWRETLSTQQHKRGE